MQLMVERQHLDAALEVINSYLGQMGIGTKAVGQPDAQYGHGPGGTFSLPALDPNVYNAMPLPISGFQAKLPVTKTNYTTPLYGIVTGESASNGNEPTQPCQDWPEAGLTQLCTSFAPLSRQGRSSRVIDLTRIGAYNDRSDFREFTFLGDPFKGADNTNTAAALTSMGGANPANFLNNELAKQLRELRIAMIRDFAPDIFTGNPANNYTSPATTNGTGGREFYRGLDLLINTGYRDVVTQALCNASDSIVETFGQNISAANSAIVLAMDSQYYRQKRRAEQTGLNPVTFNYVMRPDMFYELTAVWPCAYYTTRCQVGTGATEFVDSQAMITLRDQMRDGHYLLMQGDKVPVVLDDAVAQVEVTPGVFRSKIYLVPMTVLGNIPVTYMEYFDFNGPGAAGDVVDQTKLFGVEVIDDGRYLMTLDKNNTCIKIQLISRQRLLVRTPFLAAQLGSVSYQPIRSSVSPFPSDPYFVNGGAQSYPAPSYYTPTTNG